MKKLANIFLFGLIAMMIVAAPVVASAAGGGGSGRNKGANSGICKSGKNVNDLKKCKENGGKS